MKILPLHIDYGTRYNPFSQFCCQVLDFKEGDETQTNSKRYVTQLTSNLTM